MGGPRAEGSHAKLGTAGRMDALKDWLQKKPNNRIQKLKLNRRIQMLKSYP